MKILFLCKSNIFRSQIAEAFFNKYSKQHVAESAGFTIPDRKNHKLVIKAMNEKGIDISNKYSKRLTPEMAESANKIILMSKDLLSFAGSLPEKAEVWDIEDSFISEEEEDKYPEIAEKRDRIEKKVKELIRKIE